MTIRSRAAAPAALTLSLALVLTGCGGADPTGDPAPDAQDATTAPDAADGTSAGDDSATTSAAAAFPVTLDTAAGEVTIDEQPQRIVSLSPSATETLFAIGAGEQVVAVDAYSTYPEEAPVTDLSGYDPNVEAIVGYEPDLVVVANDSNDLVASLDALDIPVLVNPAPADIEAGYDGMAALGIATGRVDETAGVVEDLRAQIDAAFQGAPQEEGLRVYHELDDSFYSASSHSFIGSVYERMGAVNIADEADADRAGYPQLTEEAIIEADPQLIVITDQVSYTAEDVAARPGWADVSAVREGNIVVVDADIASRWGPRLPQLVETVAGAMSQVGAPVGR
ncbi:ABC transporter substrate-binding protein [Ornithinimicrobium cavernae]|uniref:ABC transporter substrate-binding protein n=1 Tax=Ornithinimicrobium cavernae TaxID=2666047 RepID=UPI000D68D3EC|nr:ABC transporter substrate-binding protein [Ornithinimicrobium cavernae]